MTELYCDIAVLACLCIARGVFHCDCIEFYVPAFLVSFLEPVDLPDGHHRLVTDVPCNTR